MWKGAVIYEYSRMCKTGSGYNGNKDWSGNEYSDP